MIPNGCGSKFNQGTAGCGPSFQLPGLNFGCICLTHRQMKRGRINSWRPLPRGRRGGFRGRIWRVLSLCWHAGSKAFDGAQSLQLIWMLERKPDFWKMRLPSLLTSACPLLLFPQGHGHQLSRGGCDCQAPGARTSCDRLLRAERCTATCPGGSGWWDIGKAVLGVGIAELWGSFLSYCGWTKSISHRFETMGKPIGLVFPGESSFQGFSGGAGFRPSTVSREFPSCEKPADASHM